MKTLRLFPLLLCISACSMPYRPAQFMEAGASFPGLAHFVEQTPSHQVDVLLVHGMCTHDSSWAAQVVDQLTQALADAITPPGAKPLTATAVDPRIEIVPSTVETPAGRLRFDALIWSPLTVPLKRQLCYDQTDKSPICAGEPPYPFIRAHINARVKDVLIDDCLPDPLIYQGMARDDIQRRMRAAILQVLEASDAPAGLPLMVVSESLGSKILYDTLLNMTHEEAGSRASQLALRAVDRLRFLVMAANPIPLLSLADQQIPAAAEGIGTGAVRQAVPVPPDSLQVLLQERLARRPRSLLDRSLTLVALTDPNDLLSYTLPVERYASEEVTVYNILVSNAPTWLGLLERPDRAHLNYLDNPDVGRLIACGLPSSRLCKRE